MTTKVQSTLQTLDATNQVLGRFASRVALDIRGKNKPSYTPHCSPTNRLIILHIDKLNITEKKLDHNIIKRFSGYHGGIKLTAWRDSYTKNPKKFFLRVVEHMLPKNRSKRQLINQIEFK